jgi:hypothetical protein
MLYETTKFFAAFARVRIEKYPGSKGDALKLTLSNKEPNIREWVTVIWLRL